MSFGLRRLLGRVRQRRGVPATPEGALVFGDSNTARPHGSARRWTDLAQSRLLGHVRFVNGGQDGRTTAFDTNELNGAQALPESLRRAGELRWLLVMLGTNDLKRQYGPPAPQCVVDGVSRLLDIAGDLRPELRIMLLTPPPMGRVRGTELCEAPPKMKEVAEGIVLLARSRGLPYVDLYGALDPGRCLERDGVHLSQRGRRAVAAAVANVFATHLA